MYVEAWRRQRAGEALEPLQAQLVRVIAEGPDTQKTAALQRIARDALDASW